MTGRTQAEASLAERLRDHGTALAWLGRSLLDDSDSDMEVQGARAAVIASGLALVAEVIDVLEPET
jgi:hypothetical protein